MANEGVEEFDFGGFGTFPSLVIFDNIDGVHVDRHLEIVGQPNDGSTEADHK
jgi:hypothetical protein